MSDRLDRTVATADVDPRADVALTAAVWHLAQVREDAVVGARSSVGRAAYVGPGVRVGADVKIQNLAQVYEPAVIEDGVFVGPAVVLTNDRRPRSITPDGTRKGADDWDPCGVTVRHGASIGARAVCVAPVIVGRWSMVAAGAVVVRDVPDFALVVGTPARQMGWVGRSGESLVPEGEGWVCPATGERYVVVADGLALADEGGEA